MNTRVPIESTTTPAVLSVSFNNDASCFAVGLDSGICIFHAKSCLLKATRDFNAGIGLVQMMGMTNYLALVGGGRNPKFAQNKIVIWDDLKGKIALEISTLTAVRGVQLARERIVVVLQNSVRLYKFAKPPDLVSVYETADNIHGICAMSDAAIAFPGRQPGHIQVVDLATGNVSIVPAHSSAVRALCFSLDGELMATASETGTLIRVFATRNCARIAELRRGVDPASIFSLAFNPSGTMLACTSDKSTLHIFDVPHPRRVRASPQPTSPVLSYTADGGDGDKSGTGSGHGGGGSKWGILGRIPLLPRVFSDAYSFASANFEAGEESLIGGLPISDGITLGTTRPPKGIIGWLSDDVLVVVGAGRDARWEKFVIRQGNDGTRECVREGWKRYVGNI